MGFYARMRCRLYPHSSPSSRIIRLPTPFFLEFTVIKINIETYKSVELKPEDLPEVELIPKEALTCYNCYISSECPYAFDQYNSSGDCLAMK